jgi:hypothetical protein
MAEDTKLEKSELDFCEIKWRIGKANSIKIYPEFLVNEDSEDLMIRGGNFYAIWDEEKKRWNKNRRSVQRIVDKLIKKEYERMLKEDPTKSYTPCYLRESSNGEWDNFIRYTKGLSDNFKYLDQKIMFADSKIGKDDRVSKTLPYCLKDGEAPSWEKIISTLYDPEEREKIEWAIGAILSGDAKRIQKFLVFYGPQGSGKSTIMEIVMKLFEGFCTTFKAENLVRGGDQFNLDFLAEDPLVAIDMDTNLSKIESNVLINQIVSHESIKVNEKFKGRYPIKPLCMLMLGTNQPVKITDAKSGIIRRLIDIEPSGRLIKPESKYHELMENVQYELGAIAKHCLNVYKDPDRGRTFYSDYIPERMMYRTDSFFNFMAENVDYFTKECEDGVFAYQIWARWQEYCRTSGIEFPGTQQKIVEEAKNYFDEYEPRHWLKTQKKQVRNWYNKFKLDKFIQSEPEPYMTRKERKHRENAEVLPWLNLDQTESILDQVLSDSLAQYEVVKPDGKVQPDLKWANVKTTLKDLDTKKVHYVKPPENLICIDFDIKGADDKKDPKANIEAASKFPSTYAEFSKSGAGIHLHYWYDGDVTALSSFYAPNIEVKIFPNTQNRALRRKLSYCNNLPIAHISSGLPFKEKKQVVNWDGLKDEKHLRNIIIQALKKECRPYGEEPKTITCMKYIRDVLQQAQEKGMAYDLQMFSEDLLTFASHSKNNAKECLDIYWGLKLLWPEVKEPVGYVIDNKVDEEAPIIILDCEVVQNLTLVVYKELGPEHKCIRLYNPKPREIERL